MELPNVLTEHTVYVNTNVFNCWSSYLKVFLSQGGIIEAYPPEDSVTTTTTMCLSIAPNGDYSIICSGDQIHAHSQFSCWGLVFPQTSIDATQLNHYCSLIVEQCKQRNIYGYIDIDFLSFIDPKTAKPTIWVSDLSIGYSEHVALYRVMRYITTGEFNPQKHTFTVKSKQLKQRLRNWQNGAPIYTVGKNSPETPKRTIISSRSPRHLVMRSGVRNYTIEISRIFTIVSSFKCVVHMALVLMFERNKGVFSLYSKVINMNISV